MAASPQPCVACDVQNRRCFDGCAYVGAFPSAESFRTIKAEYNLAYVRAKLIDLETIEARKQCVLNMMSQIRHRRTHPVGGVEQAMNEKIEVVRKQAEVSLSKLEAKSEAEREAFKNKCKKSHLELLTKAMGAAAGDDAAVTAVGVPHAVTFAGGEYAPNAIGEAAAVYATLILFDEKMEITAEKIATLLQAANVKCESYWPTLFEKLAKKEDCIKNLIANAFTP